MSTTIFQPINETSNNYSDLAASVTSDDWNIQRKRFQQKLDQLRGYQITPTTVSKTLTVSLGPNVESGPALDTKKQKLLSVGCTEAFDVLLLEY